MRDAQYFAELKIQKEKLVSCGFYFNFKNGWKLGIFIYERKESI